MTDITQTNFNTSTLLNEINLVIQNGVNNLLKDFLKKYTMYEETHKGVLNLPCVKSLIDFGENIDDAESYSSDDNDEEHETAPTIFVSIKEMTQELVTEEIKSYHDKMLSSIESLTSNNSSIIQQLLSQVELLKDEIKELKGCVFVKRDIVDLTNVEDNNNVEIQQEIATIVKDVLAVVKEEKENIILNMDENVSQNNTISNSDTEEEDEEEQEDEAQTDQAVELKDEHESESEEEEEEAEEEEEEAEEEVESEADEEEEEFFEIEIDDTTYCTNDEENGVIYELSSEGDVGKKVGFLKNGEATFYE